MEANPHELIARDKISLREACATFDEGRLFARYLNTAAEGFFRFMLGGNYLDILTRAYLKPDHDLSYKNVTFAETGGRIVGMFSGFSAEEHHRGSQSTLSDAAGVWNFRFWFISILFSPLMRIIDTVKDGDFYLQAITVEGDIRGQGIGSILLDLAEIKALEKGAKRIALDVSKNNMKAFQLYERHGYAVESSWPKYFRIPTFMLFRMTKELESKASLS